MEALRPFNSYFSVALSSSGSAVRRRVAVLAAAGFPSHRPGNYECLRPMRCVLKKNKRRRSLLFKETDDPGKLPDDKAVENGKKEGPLHCNETVDFDGVFVEEVLNKSNPTKCIGNVEVYIPSAADDAGTATETFTTIELDEKESTEDKKLHTIVQRIIIFVTSEAAPYSKTGGLADVCGSLPIALAARGHRVMVVSPRYLNGVSDKKYAASFDTGVRLKVPCFGDEPEVGFFHEYRAGVDWVFVDHPSYHRPGNPYGDENGAFGDNQFRFTILCHAACEAPLILPLGGYTYGQNCFFLVNDWHAGLVPLLLAAKYRPHGVYKDARSILVIHNLAHQGVEPAATYHKLGLPPDWYGAVEWVFPTWARTHALDKGETVNILKGAIVTADRIVTVSQGYAWEITTVEGGCGLQDLLSNRKSVLNGITNGIDIDDWDPASDKHIPFHYSIDNLSGKVGSLLCMQSSSFAKCKAALQKELGFAIRSECPVIGFIGRLDYQKGTDLIMMAIPELLQHDIQFVNNLLIYVDRVQVFLDVLPYALVHPLLQKGCSAANLSADSEINGKFSYTLSVMLGSGDRRTENWMRSTEFNYKEKFRGWVGFNIPVSHRITAGCDMLLMPSRFEPCGLNQLYAMRYATVPVVHKTGGLRDTVENFDPFAENGNGRGTGWAFSPLTKESMLTVSLNIHAYSYSFPSR
ncbi:hypothetical protein IEQ34_020804 [Dendrobium chrysotoxum]|uniref:starch synthase n=1 Tax=Dendrobium chrysotoxum TaxID=161865 RepID=A0AAV7G328_DENCH|nr:hypothetical protein IEQ34_020804 [Dendrobium chrysotoxum]